MDQLIIPKLIFFFIPITYLVDIVRRNSVSVTHGSERVKTRANGMTGFGNFLTVLFGCLNNVPKTIIFYVSLSLMG